MKNDWEDIIAVAAKELKFYLTDKVILLQILLIPFIVVFGYSLMLSTTLTSAQAHLSDPAGSCYSVNTPESFKAAFSELGIAESSESTESLKKAVENKTCDLLIVFPEDFKMAEGGSSELSDISVFYNSEKGTSGEMFTKVSELFASMQPRIFSYNSDENVQYDLFDSGSVLMKMMGGVIPSMVLFSVFMICMNLASNSIAGDKEKGFLYTMLITPVKRSSIAAGKSLAVLAAAVLGSLSGFIAMALSLPRISGLIGMEEGGNYSAGEYLMLLLSVVSASFVLVGILLIVSALSKDVKQATTIAPMFMILLLVPSILSSTEGFSGIVDKAGIINQLIPVWNSSKLMRNIIEQDYSAGAFFISIAVNAAAAVIGILIVGRMFESEKIIYD